MRIIVVGLGQTGQELAKELISAGHEIIVIDTTEKTIEDFTNEYDAIGVVGSGASKQIQVKAKAQYADVLIALSPSDEVNIMSAITAKTLGTKYTIARVTAEEYKEDEAYLMHDLGIDLVINEEYDTAQEITRLISYPTSIKVGAFANGKVDVAEVKIKENSELINLKLVDTKEKLKKDVIIASILRDEKLIIPRGDVVLKENDELCIIGKSAEIYYLLKRLDLIEKPIKSVFVVGCGKIGKYLLNNLSKMNIKTKVVEENKERCLELAEEFKDIDVIHGNGTNSDMLLEEGIKDYDACISLTKEDETNIVITLFAWSCKVRKLITKVVSLTYTKMLHNVEINNTLSPHIIILSSVHRFIRGIAERKESIKSLYRFSKNMAEAIEFEVGNDFIHTGKTLQEIKIKKEFLIAFLIRGKEIIIPNGQTTIEKKDRVTVISSAEKNLSRIEEIIEE